MNRWEQCELAYEWRVAYETRLGILCEERIGFAALDRTPTPEQEQIARTEADAAVSAMTIPAQSDCATGTPILRVGG